jgi:hypothetical protein
VVACPVASSLPGHLTDWRDRPARVIVGDDASATLNSVASIPAFAPPSPSISARAVLRPVRFGGTVL